MSPDGLIAHMSVVCYASMLGVLIADVCIGEGWVRRDIFCDLILYAWLLEWIFPDRSVIVQGF